MDNPRQLLDLFNEILDANGTDADSASPWRAWTSFKQFARVAADVPDSGVSVQSSADPATGVVTLEFIRQVLEPDGSRLEPVGGLVCEIEFAADELTNATDLDYWSFDYPTFEDFAAAVEQDDTFARLISKPASRSGVRWIED